MTKVKRAAIDRSALSACALMAVAAALAFPMAVDADVRPSVEVEAGTAIASNPFLIEGTGRGALVTDVGVRPSIRIDDGKGLELTADGLFAGRDYSRRYDDLLYGRANVSADYRRNEWLSVMASASYNREPLVDRVGTDIDASVDSTGVREGKSARIALLWHPDAYTGIQPEFSYERGHYPNLAFLRDTRTTGFSVSATRRTGPLTTLGIRAGYSDNGVDGAGDSKIYSLYGTISRRLSGIWNLHAELGVEHSRIADGPGPTFGTTVGRSQAAGRVELCRDAPRLSLCANGALTSEVSGLGGLQRRFDLGATARWRLSERFDMQFDGRYQRATQQRSTLPGLGAAQAMLRLNRRLNSRLTASAIAEYRYREPPGGRGTSSAMAGVQLRYALGAR